MILLKCQSCIIEEETFGDSWFGHAVFADFFNIHIFYFYLRLGNPDSYCNCLPLPMLPFLDDMSQTRKWKMKSKNQRILGCGSVEEMTPGSHNLIGSKINRCAPFWLFQMDGVEHRIDDI